MRKRPETKHSYDKEDSGDEEDYGDENKTSMYLKPTQNLGRVDLCALTE